MQALAFADPAWQANQHSSTDDVATIMSRWLFQALLLLFLCLPRLAPATTPPPPQTPLILGVLPFESAIALFKLFAPLREYLSQQLKRPVLLQTARNFSEFIQRTQARSYDMVITAPHFTLLALDSGYYTLCCTYTAPLAADIVVRDDSPVHTIEQLAGKRIATPPRSAIITLIGKHYLKTHGLYGPRAPRYLTFRTHNASDQAALGKQVAAAIVSINVYRRARQQGAALRLIARTPDVPGMGVLMATNLPRSVRNAFQSTLVNMLNTPAGRHVLKTMAYPGYKPATAKDFEAARPYLKAYLQLQSPPLPVH